MVENFGYRKIKMKLIYDPTKATVSYGFYVCPECQSSFYGGGQALHNSGCSQIGYSNCHLHFGDKHVEMVLETSKRNGEDGEWYGISKKDLIEQYPELVK
jgi:hypothetical protein